MKSKLREVVRDDQDIFDYIGIQPMTPPSGTIFLLKNKYGSNTFIDGKTDGVKNINQNDDNTALDIQHIINLINLP